MFIILGRLWLIREDCLPVVDVAALLTPLVFLFPIVVEVEMEDEDPIILSMEFPMPPSSPNSECNDE